MNDVLNIILIENICIIKIMSKHVNDKNLACPI